MTILNIMIERQNGSKKSVNKKVINATPLMYNGIQFRSKLEVTVYKAFVENNIFPKYECEKHIIWEGFKPTRPFYIQSKNTREVTLSNIKQINITYTPDLEFDYNGYKVFIEVKPSYCNDVYPYKRKLFRKYLEAIPNSIYAQLSSRRDTLQFINILKNNYNNERA